MSQFIAIPVGAGDSFFLERNGRTILVDGGRAEHGFPTLFQKATSRKNVDVVICTHNDADHANGVIGFLKAENFRCSEVWLPGTWSQALPHILGSVTDVINRLEEEIQLRKQRFDLYRISARHFDPEAYELIEGGSDSAPLTEQGWPKSLEARLDEAQPWGIEREDIFRLERHDSVAAKQARQAIQLPQRELNELWQAIKAAKRIREIAIEAYKRKIKVRWFEYDTQNPSGGELYLEPLNAKELKRHQIPSSSRSLLFMLSLSEVNQRSLVFWSPGTSEHPGVLFTADSDLKKITLPIDISHAIVTTPHHGSRANAFAYKLLSNTNGFNTTVWIRSDGRYQSRPCDDYVSLRQQRFCTTCRNDAVNWNTHQTVILNPNHGVWTVDPSCQPCSC